MRVALYGRSDEVFVTRISRLQIENFRSIESLDLALPQVAALVGPNSAGKSNLLEAITRVLGRDWVSKTSFDEDDVFGADPERDITITLSFDPPLSHQPFKYGDPTSITSLHWTFTRYKKGEQKGERRLEQSCLNAKGEPAMVLAEAPKKGVAPKFKPLTSIPSDVRDAIPLIFLGATRPLRDHLPGAKNSMLRRLFEDVAQDFANPANTIASDDGSEKPRADVLRDLLDQAMQVLRTDGFNAIEAAIKRNALRHLGFDPGKDGGKLDLYFAPIDAMTFYRTLALRVREGSFAIDATELGDGVQNAIVLAILQAFEERRKKGAILLIEEPEMYLHPQMQRSLHRTIQSIGTTNQVIYTTHSTHFVTVPDYDRVLLVRKDRLVGKDMTTTVRASNLPPDPKRREKLIKELDPERNELFFATRLLLVEGDTEKLAFPAYAATLGLDLDRAGATIVEVGGKRNLQEFAKIAMSFGIPTGIAYDTDSSDFRGKATEEADYNKALDALATKSGTVRVWQFEKNYEHHLRTTLTEPKYQDLCQKHPGVSKPTQARLIALEGPPVPTLVEDILRWLAPDT